VPGVLGRTSGSREQDRFDQLGSTAGQVIETVDNLTGGAPFERIEDVIDPAELAAISDRYKDIARYSKEAAGGR